MDSLLFAWYFAAVKGDKNSIDNRKENCKTYVEARSYLINPKACAKLVAGKQAGDRAKQGNNKKEKEQQKGGARWKTRSVLAAVRRF